MDTDVLAVINDTRLSAEARVVVLYVAGMGPGIHEISHRELSRLLNNPGDKRLRAAVLNASDLWLNRTPGGRGHHDRYEFRVAPGGNLSDSPAAGGNLNVDRVAAGGNLKCASSPSTDTSPPPPPTARAQPADLDVARLKAYLGEHGRAVDLMIDSAAHSPAWVAAVLGKYGPAGTQAGVFGGIGEDRRPAVLADAITEYATGGKEYGNRHFDGYVRKAADAERRGPIGRRDSGGPPAAEGLRTGTDDASRGRRSGFVYE